MRSPLFPLGSVRSSSGDAWMMNDAPSLSLMAIPWLPESGSRRTSVAIKLVSSDPSGPYANVTKVTFVVAVRILVAVLAMSWVPMRSGRGKANAVATASGMQVNTMHSRREASGFDVDRRTAPLVDDLDLSDDGMIVPDKLSLRHRYRWMRHSTAA